MNSQQETAKRVVDLPVERAPELSIVIPVFDERDSLPRLCEEIAEALGNQRTYEVVFVDDGSADDSADEIRRLAQEYPWVRGVFLRRNYGQTAAMTAGVKYARGSVVVFMDADLQNDPADIPRLLSKLDEGYEVVSGWRKKRRDSLLTRTLPSRMANWMIRRVSGVPIHDLGCSLKAFRADIIKEVRLYGEMHRFIPIYAGGLGAKIIELEVNHRPRKFGRSKYRLRRAFGVMLDLITVKFLHTYMARPMHFFGGMGILSLLAACVSGVGLMVHKYVHDISMIRSPLLLLSAMFCILAVNFILMGVLAEVQARTYFESQDKDSYRVRETTDPLDG